MKADHQTYDPKDLYPQERYRQQRRSTRGHSNNDETIAFQTGDIP